jgi:hypothetical protein
MRQGKINMTSALEVAETSAIGRALANLGLMGGEYASSNEVFDAVANQQTPPPPEPVKRTRPVIVNSIAETLEPPSVSQYNFYQPNSSSQEDVAGVYQQIDDIQTNEELTAYFTFLSDLLPHMHPEDQKEIKASFKARNNQLKG